MRPGRLTLIELVTVVLLSLVVAAGCSAGGDGAGETPGSAGTTVSESGLAFSPPTLEVNAGDTVTFVNEDSVDHQVLIGGVTLARQTPGESVTWTAGSAGTIDYICTLHPSMRGRLVVK
ncbi:MAG: cupredoxin domain-containing protein [Coriobacteriia bacterium]|nr:cupredoxin domain-containing protein [Actinomycetota bacterium]MDZ4167840.1 cupredoxin domain-containing protein [Coriobacteriia bacterium]